MAAAEPDTGYRWLYCRCHRAVVLSPEDAVLAEARAVIGDCTIVFRRLHP